MPELFYLRNNKDHPGSDWGRYIIYNFSVRWNQGSSKFQQTDLFLYLLTTIGKSPQSIDC